MVCKNEYYTGRNDDDGILNVVFIFDIPHVSYYYRIESMCYNAAGLMNTRKIYLNSLDCCFESGCL